MQIAVIGAGMCGMRCALRLQAQGFDVRVFDKGRVVGGRMTSKRLLQGYGDMGAQYFTARSALFQQQVSQWQQQGWVNLWPLHLAAWSPHAASGQLRASPDRQLRYSATPTMHAVVKALQQQFEQHYADHADAAALLSRPRNTGDNKVVDADAPAWPQWVNVSHTLTSLCYQPPCQTSLNSAPNSAPAKRWLLSFADGKQWQADAVVLAMPPVQAHALVMSALDMDAPNKQAVAHLTAHERVSATAINSSSTHLPRDHLALPRPEQQRLSQMAEQLQQAPALLPCWAVLLQFSSTLPLDLTQLDSAGMDQLDGIFIEQRAARWIACLDAKRPGAKLVALSAQEISNRRQSGSALDCSALEVASADVPNSAESDPNGSLWLVHFSADWSAQHIDASTDELQAAAHAELAAVLADVLTSPMPAPIAVQTHRWRYAIGVASDLKPGSSLEQGNVADTAPSTPSTTPQQAAMAAIIAVPECAIWAGGDWCLGGRVENAYLMGDALAQHLIETLDGPSSS